MSRIRRADLAEAILDEIERPRFVGQAVFVVG
jgi:putative NADH-flavin reductase